MSQSEEGSTEIFYSISSNTVAVYSSINNIALLVAIRQVKHIPARSTVSMRMTSTVVPSSAVKDLVWYREGNCQRELCWVYATCALTLP